MLFQVATASTKANNPAPIPFKSELEGMLRANYKSNIPWMDAFYLRSGSHQDEMFRFYAVLRTPREMGGYSQEPEDAYLLLKGFLAQQTPDSLTLVAKYGLTAKDMEALVQVKWGIGREAAKGNEKHEYAYFQKRMSSYEKEKGRENGAGAMKYLLDSLGSRPHNVRNTKEQRALHEGLKAIFLGAVPHFLKDFSNAQAEKLLGKIENRWPK